MLIALSCSAQASYERGGLARTSLKLLGEADGIFLELFLQQRPDSLVVAAIVRHPLTQQRCGFR